MVLLIVYLQKIEHRVDVGDNIRAGLDIHRRVGLRERGLVIDTPVVVGTLGDREDLILQGVAVVADDTDLDVRGGWHSLAVGMTSTILKIG